MRRAGRNERVHHHPLDGHEDCARGQKVSVPYTLAAVCKYTPASGDGVELRFYGERAQQIEVF